MKKGRTNTKASGRATPGAVTDQLSLPQAAHLIGVDPADLAGFIREAGLEPEGPESEWRLAAEDVLKLKSEREKAARRNLNELEMAVKGLE